MIMFHGLKMHVKAVYLILNLGDMSVLCMMCIVLCGVFKCMYMKYRYK
jgi:hypothetical protein